MEETDYKLTNPWIRWPVIILVAVVLLDELIYKNVRVAYRGEHWSHLWYLKNKPALQEASSERGAGNSVLNHYYRNY